MEKVSQKRLVIIAYITLAIAVLSGFTTIIGYTNSKGIYKSFTLLDIMLSSDFESFVMLEYHGSIDWDIDIVFVRVVAVVAIIAVLCAAVGLKLLSDQSESSKPFALTLIGLIGTMIPSLLLLICIVVLKNDYVGIISCGIYPVVSPIAMLISIYAAAQVHRKNIEYHKKLNNAKGLIYRGGDL